MALIVKEMSKGNNRGKHKGSTRFSAIFIIGVMLLGLSGCNLLDPILTEMSESVRAEMEATATTPEPTPVPIIPEVMNNGINTSVDYADIYYPSMYQELLPSRNLLTGIVKAMDVDGSAYVYIDNDGIHYKNTESGHGIDIPLNESSECVLKLSLSNNNIYVAESISGETHISRYYIDENNTLWGSYEYIISDLSLGNYGQIFADDDTFYLLTSGDIDGNNQELRKYVCEEGFFDRELEPACVKTVRNYEGFVFLNNNVYLVKSGIYGDSVISVADLINSTNDSAYLISYEDIPSIYAEGCSEFVDFLGIPVYMGNDGIRDVNYVMPIGFTSVHVPEVIDINKDGSIYLLAYNNIYRFVEDETPVPEIGEYMNGRFTCVYHSAGVYEDEEGTFATFTLTDSIVYTDEELELFLEQNNATYSENTDIVTMREITINGDTIYAVQGDYGFWTLYHNPNGYIAGVGGGNIWVSIDTVTLRISESCEYHVVVPDSGAAPGFFRDNGNYHYADDEENLLQYYLEYSNYDDVVISVRRDEVNAIYFVYHQ